MKKKITHEVNLISFKCDLFTFESLVKNLVAEFNEPRLTIFVNLKNKERIKRKGQGAPR